MNRTEVTQARHGGSPTDTSDWGLAHSWTGFSAMCMATRNVPFAATALAGIRATFGVKLGQMSRMQTAHNVSNAVAVLLIGTLMPILPMRWQFVCTTVVFRLTSAGLSATDGSGARIGWRGLQRVLAGAMIPEAFSLARPRFTLSRQGIAMTPARVLAVPGLSTAAIVCDRIIEPNSCHGLSVINALPVFLAAGVAASGLVPRMVADNATLAPPSSADRSPTTMAKGYPMKTPRRSSYREAADPVVPTLTRGASQMRNANPGAAWLTAAQGALIINGRTALQASAPRLALPKDFALRGTTPHRNHGMDARNLGTAGCAKVSPEVTQAAYRAESASAQAHILAGILLGHGSYAALVKP